MTILYISDFCGLFNDIVVWRYTTTAQTITS